MPRIIDSRLIAAFENRDSFSRNELFDFFKSFEPELKEGTLGWRIYDLKNRNIIKPVGRGMYTVSYKHLYRPQISDEISKISKVLNKRYEAVKYCIWDTGWVNEFSQHQSFKKIIIIESEKEFMESLYFYMSDAFRYDLYLNPDDKAIDFYIPESNLPIVINRLVSRSPIRKVTERKVKIPIPSLEKMLVDIFSDEKLLYAYQGSELKHIYENAINKYSINFTKLFSYARRRSKENEIKSFLSTNLMYLLQDVIDV